MVNDGKWEKLNLGQKNSHPPTHTHSHLHHTVFELSPIPFFILNFSKTYTQRINGCYNLLIVFDQVIFKHRHYVYSHPDILNRLSLTLFLLYPLR